MNIGKGYLNTKVPEIKTDNEIEALNKNFNLMIERLKMQQDKLLLSERHEAWENVARKLAHEIKNPLTPIQLIIDRFNSKFSILMNEKDKSDLQLKQLQQQFTPHFLFNNLNILSSLIPMDTKLAGHYVQLLSSLYRFVTRHLNEELISLDEEFEFVEHYSELMNIRFVDSYNVKITTNGQDKRKLLVVPGALQACVENAIKHNVASSDEPLLIEILLDDADKKIVVTNKIINKVHQLDISGVGINNLKQRYKAISDKPVEVTSDQSRFTISFPFINHTVE